MKDMQMEGIKMEKVLSIINQVREAKGPKAKGLILKDNKDNFLLKTTLLATYNPRANYGISLKKIKEEMKKNIETRPTEFEDIFKLLITLNENNINNQLREAAINFIKVSPEELQDLYIGMITNDLRLGIGITTINKMMDNLIPTFNVQLAGKYQDELLEDGTWFTLTEKLNGVRCVYVDGELISRQGKKFTGLQHIIDEIEKMHLTEFVLDGELIHCNNDEIDDNANFRRTTSIVNSDAETKEEIKFVLFDVISKEEFENKISSATYLQRRHFLDSTIGYYTREGVAKMVEATPTLYQGNDKSKIMELLTVYTAKGKEGLMLNTDSPYECKRHKGILKVKKMQTVDLLVVDIVEGRRDMEGKLGAVIVEYKGNTVNVGSGFKLHEREEFWEDPSLIKGRIIEVQYFEETKNKYDNKLSLQFPVFKGVRYDKTEPSYN